MSPRVQTKIQFDNLDSLADHLSDMGLGDRKLVIISDTNVWAIYGERLAHILKGFSFIELIIPAGESSKSFAQYLELIDRLLDIPIDRSTPILAFGGGVVGDLAGFVASSIFRGVPLVQIPTTLIAQVDSSIGGKTGINHETGKNLIGAFYPASLILVDIFLLNSLPSREGRNGLAEVLKAGLIRDKALVEYISDNRSAILAHEPEAILHIVKTAAQIKLDVVAKDEFESGLRAILNFGHTFAHAIENTLGYGEIGHGEAVGIGMMAALRLSELCNPNLDFSKEIDLVQELVAPRPVRDLDPKTMANAFLRDKKRSQGQSRFIVLDKLGSAEISSDILQSQADDVLREALSRL